MATSPRTVVLPPAEELLADGNKLGGWWHDTAEPGRMICDLCPRACNLKSGDRGFCFVRQNRDGEMVLTTYGRSTGFCIDPIEKKPLNHFYPGTSVLSFGTAGCNLGCKFCQNHDISKARQIELLSEQALPETIARAAKELGCHSVAYTYNDPVIWAEYAIDTAKACREIGVKSVAVTAGYITAQARAPFFEFFDAANVDLKAFTETFYEQLTLSHLQPVLDTIAWLKHETDVWFEITNLIIPGENDSASELRQLCDWVLEHVGDQVPVHFSAFHPDFKMLDRPHTRHETLLAAYDVARQTGLKYVYVGNVNDLTHQSTYCGHCGSLAIERDWYQLGAYQLNDHQCTHCGHTLPGRFGARPGDWGRKRLPVDIAQYTAASSTANIDASRTARQGETTVSPSKLTSGKSDVAWQFTASQQATIQRAACEFVAAAVTGRSLQLDDPTLEGLADTPVMGVYVSLKRQGRLRGCCGFTGQEMALVAGLEFSSGRTATGDVRLPPVSPSELEFLDLEVWLLQGLIPVQAKGARRAQEVVVGRDGLLISRGDQRGLLLPGVATENNYDAETFLRQVCLKAKLPPTAWREADTVLQRFEGISIKDSFAVDVLQRTSKDPPHLVDDVAIAKLADFCRQNVTLILRGAVPNYYLHEVSDGMINGAVLSAQDAAGKSLYLSQIAMRPPMPLQTTLYSLSESLAKQLGQAGQVNGDCQIDLTIFEDPAMHGSTMHPDLRGFDARSRALLLMSGKKSVWRFDPSCSPEALCNQLSVALGLRDDQLANIFSFRAKSTRVPIEVVIAPHPQAGLAERKPAVAGTFYPADADELRHMVDSMLPEIMPTKQPWRAAMVPHAGLRFSGRIAAEVLAHVDIPATVIVIGPKHTRDGVDWAVAPHTVWSLPGIELKSDIKLVDQLVAKIEHLQRDAAAHQSEHAIEVELPFLHRLAPRANVVGIVVGGGSLSSCQQFAQGLAEVMQAYQERVLLLISSDMNHYASDAETRRLDEIAMQAIETLDPAAALKVVRDNEISMCGILPAIIVLQTLNQLQPLQKSQRVAYATSADAGADTSRVVGYAGMLFD